MEPRSFDFERSFDFARSDDFSRSRDFSCSLEVDVAVAVAADVDAEREKENGLRKDRIEGSVLRNEVDLLNLAPDAAPTVAGASFCPEGLEGRGVCVFSPKLPVEVLGGKCEASSVLDSVASPA